MKPSFHFIAYILPFIFCHAEWVSGTTQSLGAHKASHTTEHASLRISTLPLVLASNHLLVHTAASESPQEIHSRQYERCVTIFVLVLPIAMSTMYFISAAHKRTSPVVRPRTRNVGIQVNVPEIIPAETADQDPPPGESLRDMLASADFSIVASDPIDYATSLIAQEPSGEDPDLCQISNTSARGSTISAHGRGISDTSIHVGGGASALDVRGGVDQGTMAPPAQAQDIGKNRGGRIRSSNKGRGNGRGGDGRGRHGGGDSRDERRNKRLPQNNPSDIEQCSGDTPLRPGSPGYVRPGSSPSKGKHWRPDPAPDSSTSWRERK